MIDFRNPYTPGAGVMPTYLAGRDDVLDNAKKSILSIASGYQAQPVVYYGLRGVGKTVLLNAIEDFADEQNFLYKHIEVKETSNFVQAISIACSVFAKSLSLKEAVKEKAEKLLAVIQSFIVRWNPESRDISIEMKNRPNELSIAGTGDLSNDITELLVTLGRYAKKADTTICFFIDEIQYAKENELEALITAIHRLNQLRLPIIFFCAGLPRIIKMLGEAKSYAERLFEYVKIDSLSRSSAQKAILLPAKKFGVSYTPEAVQKIIDETLGYPFFIQEMCYTIWKNSDNKKIALDIVDGNIKATNKRLDEGFFSSRMDRCTRRESEFLIAMAQCKSFPCTISNVAQIMKRKVNSISIFRASLISKGLIYATSYGEIDFTVPKFAEFLKRNCFGSNLQNISTKK